MTAPAKKTPEPKKPSKTNLPKPDVDLLNDNLLVSLDPPEVMDLILKKGNKASLITLPDNSSAFAYLTGTVVAAGPGIYNIHLNDKNRPLERVPMDCKRGDHVIFERRHFTPFIFRGEEYCLLRDVNILAKL